MSRGEVAPLPTVRARLARMRTVVPFACLYVAFGATFGLIGTGAPLVFRAHGVSLGLIGLLQIVSLPIGITFLWAPLIDRWRWPRMGHRLGWIVVSQLTCVALLLALSRGTGWPVAAPFALAVGVSVALATMDVALEALVVETVPRASRPMTTTAKLVGSSIGTTLGVALVTAWPELVDLPHATLAVAALDALMLLPILRYPEGLSFRENDIGDRARPTLVRLRAVGRHALVLGGTFAAGLMLSGTPSLALVDLGVPLPTIGLITGPITTALSIAAMLLSGYALARVPTHRLVLGLAAVAAASALVLAAAVAARLAGAAIGAALVHVACDAAIGVPIFNTVYRWAEGDHAATDYSVLFGTAFLVSFPVRVLSPKAAALVGWPLFFALGVPLYLAATAALARAMKRTASLNA